MTRADERVTTTGGREATTLHIPPKLALAVGMPATAPVAGWRWSALTSLARLESGHTPSRKHAEYWGGSIPWISIQDARNSHGRRVESTIEHTNDVGIANSSARILPVNTVCLSRTASVGYVVVMGRPMATSQDFVNWVCTDQLDPDFLKYIFIAEGTDLLRFASGSVHQTIYFPAAKAFYICHPSVAEQKRIVAILDEAFEGIASAKAAAAKNLQNARAIFESYLHAVFSQRGPGWVTLEIGAVAEIYDGPHATPKTVEKGPLFLGISALQDGKINLGETRHVTPDDFKQWTRRVTPQTNDVVFSYETRLGQAAIIPSGLSCCLGRRMGLVRANREKMNPLFFVYQYISPPFREFLNSRTVRGATVDRIPLKDFPSFPISLPTLDEQERLSERFESIRAQTEILTSIYERKRTALDALKKSLFHRAFAGELTGGEASELIQAVA